jgi:hypothetical protein
MEKTDNRQTAQKSQKKLQRDDKKERLSAALRDNLRRRKAALNNVGEQQNDEET